MTMTNTNEVQSLSRALESSLKELHLVNAELVTAPKKGLFTRQLAGQLANEIKDQINELESIADHLSEIAERV